MKLPVTAFLMAVLPTALAVDYTLTCGRGIYSGGGNDDEVLSYFISLYTTICINYFHCASSSTPFLGTGELVTGGCVDCQAGLDANAVGDCLLAT
ncbi:hypothetical protein E4U17_007795 [Claviceps sp. LM77 group G4]|nr:hypothetical protein E4U17_007795 [Claviceps sp. LM77 group G4]KAG6073479.1 hypothetical protein E4U33_002857 [Claviceps sp. LM78 group G4]KAG6076391.1 hypothetical protein E4U16_002790 [Claviceps sp. LM84 group G4]